MRMGLIRNSTFQGAFPYIAALFTISLLIFRGSLVQVPFEKGIEIVRSEGYELVGNHSIYEFATESVEIVETKFGAFMRICDRMREQVETLTIYSDVDARSLFLIYHEEDEGDRLYLCKFG